MHTEKKQRNLLPLVIILAVITVAALAALALGYFFTQQLSDKLTDAKAQIEEMYTADELDAKVNAATDKAKAEGVSEGTAAAEAAAAEAAEAAAAEAEAKAKEAAVNPAVEGKLIILHTNDVHGRAVSDDTQIGYARIAALKTRLEAMGAEVILMDAGDAIQGMPIVNLSSGLEAINFMNAVGYSIAVPGNHEFDYGVDNLLALAEKAQFPYVCANLVHSTGKDTVFNASKIIETKNGIKIGVFGLDTPSTMTKSNPNNLKDVTFLQGEELISCAQGQATALKNAGCQLVICLGHLGDAAEDAPNRSTDLLEKVTDIDLFIDGHSHTAIEHGIYDGESKTLRVSTGANSEAVGYVIADSKAADGLTLTAGLFTLDDLNTLSLFGNDVLEPDETVAALVNGVDAEVQKTLNAAFAKSEVDLDGNKDPGVRTMETNLGDFAADAILWQARTTFGEDVVAAITNGGGIRASISAGDVTMMDMKTVFPFENRVVILTVTGAELLEALEAATCTTPDAIGAFPQVAGIEYTINTKKSYKNGEAYPDSTYFAPEKAGRRVTITSVGGKKFDPKAKYVIATSDFVAAGGDTYYVFKYPYAQTGKDSGIALEDALINYVTTELKGVIGDAYAEPQGRITIKK